MTKVVFFDIDGTLVAHQNIIPESTKRAIKQLKEQGVIVAIATGRAPLLLEEVRAKLDIHHFVSMNGQYVVYNGKPIYKNPLTNDTVERFVNTAVERNNGIMLCGSQDVYANSVLSLAKRSSVLSVLKGVTRVMPGHLQISLLKRAMKKPPKPSEYEGKNIYQIILECSPGQGTYYELSFPELHFTRSNSFSVDVIHDGVSKALGIEKFIQHIGVDVADTYAFGDSLNDLEMMEYVGTGVAMGNALPEVKEVADRVTASVSEDGIEKGLKELGLI